MKNCLVFIIAKVYMVHDHSTLKGNKGKAICFRNLPGPTSCPFLDLFQLSFLLPDSYQRYISVILLFLFIQECIDSFCSCKGQKNIVGLLGNLGNII